MTTDFETDILSAATRLVPLLEARASEMEQARHLPSSLASTLAENGMFRLLTPKSLGGFEASPAIFSKVLQILSKGDASISWCSMIANTASLLAAYLEVPVAKEIFADSRAFVAGVFAPMGRAKEDGANYRVSGQWQWASGSANCSWFAGGAVLLRDGQPTILPGGRPEQRMMLVPAAEIELIDTWHATGLKGTGSGDVTVTEVVVPKNRTVSLLADQPKSPGALYKFPVFGLLALGIASVALGNARAALDDFVALAGEKKIPGSLKTLADRHVVQVEIAKTESTWRSARAYLNESIDRNWHFANLNGTLSTELRADLRLACTNATRQSANICKIAYDLAGGSSVFLSSNLQRRFRDAHVMTQHIMVAPVTYEGIGRVLFGLEADTSML